MKGFLLNCILLIFFLGCNAESEVVEHSDNRIVDTLQTELVLSTATDEIIANPLRIAAFDDGFALYDYALSQIQIFSGGGEIINSFGREGKGPGEFRSVTSLSIYSDQLIVSDSDLLRQYSFDFGGQLLSSYEIPATLFAADNGSISPGRFIIPTNGREVGLAKLIDSENNVEFAFGKPVVETPEIADFNQWQRDLSSGKIPDFFRNRVAVTGDDNYLYLFLQTEGILQQYSYNGDLNWELTLDLPEFEDEFERFIVQNKNNPSGRISMLQYVHKMEQHENGVYMLLKIPDKYHATVLFIDHNGEDMRLLRFNGMDHQPSRFSISPDREWIYFLDGSQGAVYRTRLLN